MSGRGQGAQLECAVCGRKVFRAHGLVALVQPRTSDFEAHALLVGYCREHHDEARRSRLWVQLRRLGRVVAHTRPVEVHAARAQAWCETTLRQARRRWREHVGTGVDLSAPQLGDRAVAVARRRAPGVIDLTGRPAGPAQQRAGVTSGREG